MQIGNRFKIGKQRKNNFNNQKNTASDKNNIFGIFIIKFKSRLLFNSLTAFIGGVMKIFENESNLLSTFPSKPIMIIFTNRKTKQTVNTPPKIPVRTLVILLLFIVIKNLVNNKSWSALCFHINLSDVFAYNADCKELKSSDCPN